MPYGMGAVLKKTSLLYSDSCRIHDIASFGGFASHPFHDFAPHLKLKRHDIFNQAIWYTCTTRQDCTSVARGSRNTCGQDSAKIKSRWYTSISTVGDKWEVLAMKSGRLHSRNLQKPMVFQLCGPARYSLLLARELPTTSCHSLPITCSWLLLPGPWRLRISSPWRLQSLFEDIVMPEIALEAKVCAGAAKRLQ